MKVKVAVGYRKALHVIVLLSSPEGKANFEHGFNIKFWRVGTDKWQITQRVSTVAQWMKILLQCNRYKRGRVHFLGWEEPMEEGMASSL